MLKEAKTPPPPDARETGPFTLTLSLNGLSIKWYISSSPCAQARLTAKSAQETLLCLFFRSQVSTVTSVHSRGVYVHA